ncbi:hypothetical protein CR513_56134, partial [Mucuna pruriens]
MNPTIVNLVLNQFHGVVVPNGVFSRFGRGTGGKEDAGLVGIDEFWVIHVGPELGLALLVSIRDCGAQGLRRVWVAFLVRTRGLSTRIFKRSKVAYLLDLALVLGFCWIWVWIPRGRDEHERWTSGGGTDGAMEDHDYEEEAPELHQW